MSLHHKSDFEKPVLAEFQACHTWKEQYGGLKYDHTQCITDIVGLLMRYQGV